MEEKLPTGIKPYLDKLTLGVTRILGEWRRATAHGAGAGRGQAVGGGSHPFVTAPPVNRAAEQPMHTQRHILVFGSNGRNPESLDFKSFINTREGEGGVL